MSPKPASVKPRPNQHLQTASGRLGVHLETPSTPGPWPAVVVLHDAGGLTPDTVRQCRWLADEGFLVAAPDLFDGGSMARCLRSIVRDYASWEGAIFQQVEGVRTWLAGRADCTGRVGVLGFCLGGGFALSLAPGYGFQAASANYGMLPKDAEQALAGACPIIGSYGGRDRTLRGAGPTLDAALTAARVEHRVDMYPDAGHGFLNDHLPGEVPFLFQLVAPLMPNGYHEASATIARERIVAFLHQHLAGPVPTDEASSLAGEGSATSDAADPVHDPSLRPGGGSSAILTGEPAEEQQPPSADQPSV